MRNASKEFRIYPKRQVNQELLYSVIPTILIVLIMIIIMADTYCFLWTRHCSKHLTVLTHLVLKITLCCR